MTRTFIITLCLSAMMIASSTVNASAYNCDHYRYGSQAWWFCMSDNDGER